ncbi:hypothetical protein ACIQXM_01855 [Arthrobacter sp. NPDC097144]|uniref:hypothetical protein n=1 Tax=Arthrobacter sp. NPDC097144 TaxID=3363946 RepID=UPI00381FFB1D
MTEVATLPQATALAVPSTAGAPALNLTATTVSLLEWAQELDAAHRLGTALCGTEFVPASFRGKPDAAAAAILAGKSLGLDPMNSLSNIFVVQGRPAMYARTMVALVLSAGHDVRRTSATPEAVTILGRRKGQQEWQEFTWTIDRARQAGYLSNKKYNTDPIAMLTAKAQAEACRTIAPDVLTGVAAYSVEDVELEDLGETPAASAATPATAKPARTIKRRATAPAPEVPNVVAEPPAPEEEPEPVDEETGELPSERDWFAEIDLAAGDVTALRALWKAASAADAAPETLDAIASAATAAKDQ